MTFSDYLKRKTADSGISIRSIQRWLKGECLPRNYQIRPIAMAISKIDKREYAVVFMELYLLLVGKCESK